MVMCMKLYWHICRTFCEVDFKTSEKFTLISLSKFVKPFTRIPRIVFQVFRPSNRKIDFRNISDLFCSKCAYFFVVVVFQVCFLCNGKYLNRNVCFWTAAIVIVWLIAVKYRVVFWLVFSIIFIQDVSINGARILAKRIYICFLEFLLFKAIKAVVTFGPCVSITS